MKIFLTLRTLLISFWLIVGKSGELNLGIHKKCLKASIHTPLTQKEGLVFRQNLGNMSLRNLMKHSL